MRALGHSDRPFGLVVADPPWSFSDSLPGETRGASKRYSTMSTDALCHLDLPPIADDALLLLWRVAAMAEDAYRLARAWGFEPKSELVWVKLPKLGRATDSEIVVPKGTTAPWFAEMLPLAFGMGRYVRNAHETCLIARRGRAKVADHAVRSVFFAPAGEHSEKPAAFYRLAEKLAGNVRRVELFARADRPGWTCLGDQAPEPTKLRTLTHTDRRS